MTEFPTNNYFDVTKCREIGHPLVWCGLIEFCMVCHWRTDESFVNWSRSVLERAMERAELREAA